MKRVLSAVVIAQLMILSYVAGRQHSARPAVTSTSGLSQSNHY